jgi:hypothetical protein
MKTIERKVYYCEHCKYKSLSASHTSKHEKYCLSNPLNAHKCFQMCVHLERTKVACGYNSDGYPISKTEFTCAETGKKLYSALAEKKGIVHLIKDAERMPLECELYEEFEPETTQFDD